MISLFRAQYTSRDEFPLLGENRGVAGISKLSCKGPDYKCFRLCGPYNSVVFYFFKQSFKHVKTILSSWAVKKTTTECGLNLTRGPDSLL